MRYVTDRDDPDTWLTLDQIRKQLPKGNWSHNRVLEEVDTAVSLQIPPSEFWSWDSRDQAYTIAAIRVKRTMESYDYHLQKEDRGKKS